jgi:hypothetical protein
VADTGRRDTNTEFSETIKESVHLDGLGVERNMILK